MTWMIQVSGDFLHVASSSRPVWAYSQCPGGKEGVSRCASLFQVSACVVFSNIVLAKANHITKPRFKGENINLPPDGKSSRGACRWGLEKSVVILKPIPVTVEIFLCVQLKVIAVSYG